MAKSSKSLVRVDSSGAPIVTSAKYARNAVQACYEAMGGDEAFAEWAVKNKGDFYTKIFTKTIQKEHNITSEKTPEEIFADIPDEAIDGEYEIIEDAEYEDVDHDFY